MIRQVPSGIIAQGERQPEIGVERSGRAGVGQIPYILRASIPDGLSADRMRGTRRLIG